MKTFRRAIAVAEILLIFPATLFMLALFLRGALPVVHAGRFVDWFVGLPVEISLDLLLVLLPFGALVIGSATLLRSWQKDPAFREAARFILAIARAHAASLLTAAVTLISGIILCLVALHVITG